MNSLVLDKRQIERQFERAALSYNRAAALQQSIITELLKQTAQVAPPPSNIADLGCGTGLGLMELERRFSRASLLGVDIAQAMLEQASQACSEAELLKADIENLPLKSQSLDLVFSTSTLQWCNLEQTLSECTRILEPGGHLALATFGPKTHIESVSYTHLEQKDRVGLIGALANLPEPPESVPINMLIAIEGTPLEDVEKLDNLEFIRTIAVARITMPRSYVRLSAGREEMTDEMQALCYMAGANSVFYGDELLTASNASVERDKDLFSRLGISH